MTGSLEAYSVLRQISISAASKTGTRRMRQLFTAMRFTSSLFRSRVGVRGRLRVGRGTASKALGSSSPITIDSAVSPCFHAFIRDRVFPVTFLGPALRFAFSRFAALIAYLMPLLPPAVVNIEGSLSKRFHEDRHTRTERHHCFMESRHLSQKRDSPTANIEANPSAISSVKGDSIE